MADALPSWFCWLSEDSSRSCGRRGDDSPFCAVRVLPSPFGSGVAGLRGGRWSVLSFALGVAMAVLLMISVSAMDCGSAR
ncbi:hypothetical protein [Variovorax sp. ZT4R33]|uniref:hypothetical protein n=1 Tax=Variovorax sp. ZT4R33 TaxID=3443743 RepID=UPI003F4832BA